MSTYGTGTYGAAGGTYGDLTGTPVGPDVVGSATLAHSGATATLTHTGATAALSYDND